VHRHAEREGNWQKGSRTHHENDGAEGDNDIFVDDAA
jgi:hypothetical protein